MKVVALADDLSRPIGTLHLLFNASIAKWVRNIKDLGYKNNGPITEWYFFTPTEKERRKMDHENEADCSTA